MGHRHEIEMYELIDQNAGLSLEEQCAAYKDKLQRYACMMDIFTDEYEKVYLEFRRSKGLPVFSDNMFSNESKAQEPIAVAEPVVETPVAEAEAPVVEMPMEIPVAEAPVVEMPVEMPVEIPVAVAETPVVEMPVEVPVEMPVEIPVAEAPVVEMPVEIPVAEVTAEAPVVEMPVAEAPEEPVNFEPAPTIEEQAVAVLESIDAIGAQSADTEPVVELTPEQIAQMMAAAQ